MSTEEDRPENTPAVQVWARPVQCVARVAACSQKVFVIARGSDKKTIPPGFSFWGVILHHHVSSIMRKMVLLFWSCVSLLKTARLVTNSVRVGCSFSVGPCASSPVTSRMGTLTLCQVYHVTCMNNHPPSDELGGWFSGQSMGKVQTPSDGVCGKYFRFEAFPKSQPFFVCAGATLLWRKFGSNFFVPRGPPGGPPEAFFWPYMR